MILDILTYLVLYVPFELWLLVAGVIGLIVIEVVRLKVQEQAAIDLQAIKANLLRLTTPRTENEPANEVSAEKEALELLKQVQSQSYRVKPHQKK